LGTPWNISFHQVNTLFVSSFFWGTPWNTSFHQVNTLFLKLEKA
jgi:hypothetical protein